MKKRSVHHAGARGTGNTEGNTEKERITMVNEEAWKEIENFIFIGEERMQPADLMIVPGAPQELLAHHAAGLFHGGFAKAVLVSGKFSYRRQSFAEEWKAQQGKEDTGPGGDTGVDPASYQTEAAWLKALMVREGVPESAIWTEEESTNTFENARFCRKLLEAGGIRPHNILLCTQAFHARRAKMTFQSEFVEQKIYVSSVVTRGIGRGTWMQTQEGFDTVMKELENCGAYFSGKRMYESACMGRPASERKGRDH
ncbi:MAG: YdcF family protein [Lachnospiraceae bacterium]|nr:YdcF family protein [Lachnospiraceae bacterium]